MSGAGPPDGLATAPDEERGFDSLLPECDDGGDEEVGFDALLPELSEDEVGFDALLPDAFEMDEDGCLHGLGPGMHEEESAAAVEPET